MESYPEETKDQEIARLKEAVKHLGHFLESPSSYSQEEKEFLFRVVETGGKILMNGV